MSITPEICRTTEYLISVANLWARTPENKMRAPVLYAQGPIDSSGYLATDFTRLAVEHGDVLLELLGAVPGRRNAQRPLRDVMADRIAALPIDGFDRRSRTMREHFKSPTLDLGIWEVPPYGAPFASLRALTLLPASVALLDPAAATLFAIAEDLRRSASPDETGLYLCSRTLRLLVDWSRRIAFRPQASDAHHGRFAVPLDGERLQLLIQDYAPSHVAHSTPKARMALIARAPIDVRPESSTVYEVPGLLSVLEVLRERLRRREAPQATLGRPRAAPQSTPLRPHEQAGYHRYDRGRPDAVSPIIVDSAHAGHTPQEVRDFSDWLGSKGLHALGVLILPRRGHWVLRAEDPALLLGPEPEPDQRAFALLKKTLGLPATRRLFARQNAFTYMELGALEALSREESLSDFRVPLKACAGYLMRLTAGQLAPPPERVQGAKAERQPRTARRKYSEAEDTLLRQAFGPDDLGKRQAMSEESWGILFNFLQPCHRTKRSVFDRLCELNHQLRVEIAPPLGVLSTPEREARFRAARLGQWDRKPRRAVPRLPKGNQ